MKVPASTETLNNALDGICNVDHTCMVEWVVEIGDEFEPEFNGQHADVRTEILAHTRLLKQFGPRLGRPRVDTLDGSRHANMKELRFDAADGVWRVARGLCLRSEAQGHPARGGRQVRRKRKAFLQAAHRQT